MAERTERALTLSRMRTFMEVVRLRSVSECARRMQVTQPAVSAQIREMETRLGVRLLERSGRAMVLTDAGRLLADHAERMLDLERHATQAIERMRGLDVGRLAIGASETPGHYLLLPALGRFHQEHPYVRLRVDIANSPTIAQRVSDGLLELGFIEGPIRDPALETTPLAEDHLVLIASRRDPLVKSRRVSREQLAGRNFVMREPGSAVRTFVDEMLRDAGIEPAIAFEFGTTEAVKHAVAAGLGLAFIPAASARAARHDLAIVPVSGLKPTRTLWIVRARSRVLSLAANGFLGLLRPREPRRRTSKGAPSFGRIEK